MPDLRHVLILGGTSEARGIVATLLAKGAVRVTFSLAGALGDEARASFYRKLGECDKTNLELRVGGFGGAEGLRDYLLVNGIDSMIDATHPYAARMSHNACEAARLASVPLVRFVRPAWQPTTKDNWLEVEDLDAAAAALPEGARVFLALGSQSIAPFLKRSDCQLMARSLVDPAFSRKAHMHIVKGAPGGLCSTGIRPVSHAWHRVSGVQKLRVGPVLQQNSCCRSIRYQGHNGEAAALATMF
nr:precorrin-6A/cobalt-precorrin-6A reductase [uncultured Cohaesibacter sp.]